MNYETHPEKLVTPISQELGAEKKSIKKKVR
jgi:hypothetical protein